jgi:hydrogenase-4 component F
MAVAVAMRFGAIPFHLWAARLTDVVPETSLPMLTALAPASLAVVALAWIDVTVTPRPVDIAPERLLVLAVAVATIVLAAVAAFVQDDLEHVLGYAIVSDAGVVVLALAVLEPAAGPPARTWILAFVAGRSALAAWTAAIRAGLWTGRVADLRGWVRRSPILAVAFVLVAVAGVGFPGLAAYDARTKLVDLALDQPLSTVVLIATLAPIAYYARLFVIGVAPPDHIIEAADGWRPRIEPIGGAGLRRWLTWTWDRNRPFTTAVVAALLAVLALLTAAGVLGGR